MQKTAREILKMIFDQRKERRPVYSVRAFARDLGISPATLSQAMSGQRDVSAPLMEKLLLLSDIAEPQKAILEDLIEERLRPVKKARTVSISLEEYEKVSDWYHFAILNLMKCRDFSENPEWIASRLGIETREARDAIFNLERLGLLSKSGDRWVRVPAEVRTDPTHNSGATKKTQSQLLKKAEESMSRYGFDLRDLSGSMMAIDPEVVPLARKEIKKFRSYLAGKLEKMKPAKEVYHLAVQLFPVSRIED